MALGALVLCLVQGLEGTVLLQLRADGRHDAQEPESLVQAAARELRGALADKDRGAGLEKAFRAQALLDAAQSEATALAASLRSALEQQQDGGIEEVLARLDRHKRALLASQLIDTPSLDTEPAAAPVRAAATAPAPRASPPGLQGALDALAVAEADLRRPATSSAGSLAQARSDLLGAHRSVESLGEELLALAELAAHGAAKAASPPAEPEHRAPEHHVSQHHAAERHGAAEPTELLARVAALRKQLGAGLAGDLADALHALKAGPARRLPAVARLSLARLALRGPGREDVEGVLKDLDALGGGPVPPRILERLAGVQQRL